ncbi:ankyrin repeat domain-containing protein [Candidatus Wolbachia massiliensis]|uniref:Ankyrin repeat domain-containing protein n=1 Tax=Candidatus Wolbachia massiliensis TaxID=1845000 RepID=A0A7L7YLX0_9RICK|nr:ankyrin repeat domain-containing protein [Candidatus Wolbachia massiliensis]QOD38214.1 ankyrin repeat domain-containing protein [Candidatus Wolbachia massiliensis]
MSKDQQKRDMESSMRHYWEEIFVYVKQGDRESAERRMEELVEKNKWDPKDLYGYLLCVAVQYGEIEVAEFCKDKGVDLDHKDFHIRTPLQIALQFDQTQMVKSLREWGAQAIQRPVFDYLGASSQYSRLENKMTLYWNEIIEHIKQGDRESAERRIEGLVEKNKWDPKDLYGCLLCVAACRGEVEVAEFCKDKGMDPNYEDRHKRTPLQFALRSNQTQMAEVLRKMGARDDTCSKPSPDLESPSCSGQEKQSRNPKRRCGLM